MIGFILSHSITLMYGLKFSLNLIDCTAKWGLCF